MYDYILDLIGVPPVGFEVIAYIFAGLISLFLIDCIIAFIHRLILWE